MIGRGLINRAVATFIAAGAGFVAMVALGATVYYLLALVVVPLAAAAITSALFAVIALIIALVFVRRRFGRRAVGNALLAGGIGAVSLAAVFTAIALVDFYDLFNWLHGCFFSSGTWLFPGDALLIRSLPEPLWMFLGALLVILIAAFSVGHTKVKSA